MDSYIIVALCLLVAIAAHIAIYCWVKFKIDEGVILKFLRVAGAPEQHHENAIAADTGMSVKRVNLVCQKSVEIHSDPEVANSWCADGVKK